MFSSIILREAFKYACTEIADEQCPHEFDYAKWNECEECSHNNEQHADIDRDVACWQRYYLELAEKNNPYIFKTELGVEIDCRDCTDWFNRRFALSHCMSCLGRYSKLREIKEGVK